MDAKKDKTPETENSEPEPETETEAHESELAPVEEAVPAPEPANDKATATPEEEIAGLKDKLLRALAENENMARRTRKEREDTAKFATSNMARDVLSVADNLRRALESVSNEMRSEENPAKSLVEGVELTERGLLTTLERHGIKKIEPLGEKFNHDFHEALYEVPTNDAEPGVVVQVVEVGYTIHGRLLRAARVGIAKALPEPGADNEVDTTA